MTVIETKRLLLREFTPEDVSLLAPIFADPVMMRFYPTPFTRERTKDWIEWNLGLYASHGHGLWAMIRRADGLFLGDCGIVPQVVEGVEWLEIGYHVRRDLWGNGYGSEAARACRAYAFDTLRAPRICSIVDPANDASRQVAARIHKKLRTIVWEKNQREMCLFFTEAPAGL